MLMRLFRAIASLSIGIWLGGIVTIAIVAATTFGEMRKTGVAQPNSVAGQVMARNFQRFDYVQIACAAVALIWAITSAVVGQRSGRDVARLILIVAACGLLSYNVGINTPKIISMRAELSGPDAEATVRARFDEFHASAVRVSQAIMVLLLIIGVEMSMSKAKSTIAMGPS